jgi:tetratricopeptide (TPR) repeat protein
MAWEEQPADAWRFHARAAAGPSRDVYYRDRPLAEALAALGQGDYPQACERYAALVTRDSMSFPAWFGLGQCLREDHAVVRDSRSPSGWTWRSSLRAAEAAYEHALDVVPSATFRFPPFRHLSRTLFVEGTSVRLGLAVSSDTMVFFAYPSLEHDTLAFIPVPARQFATQPRPATTPLAVAADQERLLRLVREWVREFPDSTQPFQSLATSLELVGALDAPGGIEESALRAAERARALAHTAADSVAAAVQQVRLLVKLERFDAAQRLAEAELARSPNAEAATANALASLATLVGRPRVAAGLAAAWARAVHETPAYSTVPLPVVEASLSLLSYAAVGAPTDSLAAVAARLDTLLQLHPKLSRSMDALWCDIVVRSQANAYPELRRLPDTEWCPDDPGLAMQRALARGDHAAVRSEFRRAQKMREGQLPSDLAAEHAYQEAWLTLQAGDTAEATAFISRQLSALKAMRSSVILDEPVESGALVRLMALRADLAALAGDRATARRWAEPVAILWRHASPELQPLVARMRTLTEGDRRH